MSRPLSLAPRAAWRSAFEKAVDRDDADVCQWTWSAGNGDHSVAVFDVLSWSEAETRRKVQVRLFDSGDVDASCTCPGAINGQRCWHAAAALVQLGLLISEDVGLEPPAWDPTEAELADEAAYWAEMAEQLEWERHTIEEAFALAAAYELDVEAAVA